jgi:hypothetical protein
MPSAVRYFAPALVAVIWLCTALLNDDEDHHVRVTVSGCPLHLLCFFFLLQASCRHGAAGVVAAAQCDSVAVHTVSWRVEVLYIKCCAGAGGSCWQLHYRLAAAYFIGKQGLAPLTEAWGAEP